MANPSDDVTDAAIEEVEASFELLEVTKFRCRPTYHWILLEVFSMYLRVFQMKDSTRNFFWGKKVPKRGQFHEKIEKLPWDVNADKMVEELTFGELWWLKSSLAQDSLPDWGSLLSSGEKKRRIIPWKKKLPFFTKIYLRSLCLMRKCPLHTNPHWRKII